MHVRTAALLSLLSSLFSPLSAQSADLVLRHTTIYTVDAAHPVAQSVAVKDGKIIYVGADAGVTKYVEPIAMTGIMTAGIAIIHQRRFSMVR